MLGLLFFFYVYGGCGYYLFDYHLYLRSAQNPEKNCREKYFVTRTAFFSAELNAHYLTYLIILVQQKQLPVEVLNIQLFSSQTCESTFRNTRSLSGIFSTVINYTVEDFLRRSRKLSILNGFKSQDKSTSLLKFPVHHKHISLNTTRNNQNLIDISMLNVENVVMQAYQSAVSITENLNISSVSCLSFTYEFFDILRDSFVNPNKRLIRVV